MCFAPQYFYECKIFKPYLTKLKIFMKKFLLTMASAAVACGLHAAIEVPHDMMSDFSEGIPSGWITTGVDAKVASSVSNYFPYYSTTNAYSVLIYSDETGDVSMAFSPSEFTNGAESNQWLISDEFECNYDSEILSVVLGQYVSTNPGKYKILMSEGGTSPEDFTTVIDEGEIRAGTQQSPLVAINKRVVVENVKGKKVRLAFVNEGNTSGILGFAKPMLVPYYFNLTSAAGLDLIKVGEGSLTTFNLTATVISAIEAPGVKAVLTTSGGFSEEVYVTKKLRVGKLANVSIKFKNPVEINSGYETYKIEITPDYEGAPATVISGDIIRSEYDSAVLLEEATSTGCGYCPFGFALLNYFQDKYNTEDNQRVIGAAYHALFGKQDPMYVESLFTPFQEFAAGLGFQGYPWLMINRSSGSHPANVDIESLLTEKTFGKVKIESAVYNPDTKKITVKYDAELGMDTDDMEVNAVALISENNMHGTTNVWAQDNYLTSYTTNDIAQTFGEDAVPYFSLFVGSGAKSVVPAKDMVYDDIARACYPSFSGELVDSKWENGVSRSFEMEFDLPSTVKDVEETDVVIILTYAKNGSMINADRKKLTEYTSVKGVESASLAVASNGNEVIVNAGDAGMVELFAVDGRMLGKQSIVAGQNRIAVGNYNGVVIVKAQAGNESMTSKVVIR